MDDSPAFRVEFEGPAPPVSQTVLARPGILVFRRQDLGRRYLRRKHRRQPNIPEGGEAAWDYTVQLEPNESNWLFALDYPTSAPDDTTLTMDFQLIRDQPVIQLTAVRDALQPEFHRHAGTAFRAAHTGARFT